MRSELALLGAAGLLAGGLFTVAWILPRVLGPRTSRVPAGRAGLRRALGAGPGRFVPERLAAEYVDLLAPAGRDPIEHPDDARGTIVVGGLVVGGLGVPVCLMAAGGFGLLLVPVAVALGALIPIWELRRLAARRAAAAAAAAPWMMQLLSLALRSGAAFEPALRAYAHVCRHDVLPAEIARVVRDLESQLTRQQALGRLFDRLPVPAVEALTRAVASNTANGAPIATLLTDQAARLQRAAADQADADAEMAAARMVGPLTLLAVGFVVVVLAPFIAQIGQMPR